jgi:hypothetical protein
METRRCPVCLEADDKLMPTGCACRGTSGMAHPSCIGTAASFAVDSRGPHRWVRCSECEQRYGGAFQMALLDQMVALYDRPEEPWWRKCTARLWRGVACWEQHKLAQAEVDLRSAKAVWESQPPVEQKEPGSQRQMRDINYHLGLVLSDASRYEAARTFFEAASLASEGSVTMCLSDLEIARCLFLEDPNEVNMFRYVRMSNAVIEIFKSVAPDQRKMYQVAMRSLDFILQHRVQVSITQAAAQVLCAARRIMGPDHNDTLRATALYDRAVAWTEEQSPKRKRRAASTEAARKIRAIFK